MTSKYFFVLLTLTVLLALSPANAGRGGGGRGGGGRGSSGRGSSSRGSSSRGSSSSTNSQRSSTIERKTSKNENKQTPIAQPPPKPEYQPPTRVKPSAPNMESPQPSAPKLPVQSSPNQPVNNPNLGKPPPYPGGNVAQHGNPPPYQANAQPPPYPGPSQARPPTYDASQGRPPPYPNQGGPAYGQPDQPGFRPNVAGNPNLNQPGIRPYPQQPNVANSPYPQQPGIRPYPQQPNANYPQQAGGVPYRPNSQGTNYNAPSYSQHSGMPIGGSSYDKPYKKKGLLGNLFSRGKTPKAPKYGGAPMYNPSYKNSHGMSKSMYPIMPMGMKSRKSGFSSFRSPLMFMPLMLMPLMFMPRPHFGHYGRYSSSHYYDWDSEDYRGRCRKPLLPSYSEMSCNRTELGAKCVTTCKPGYHFPDNFTQKENECWHYGGIWRPQKNFPSCESNCEIDCKNGGKCGKPNTCVCDPEYRGDNCEYHVLNCDIRKLAGEKSRKISWTCQHRRNETVCNVRCRKPPSENEQNLESIMELHCLPTGQWTKSELPKCDPDGESPTTKENQESEVTTTTAETKLASAA